MTAHGLLTARGRDLSRHAVHAPASAWRTEGWNSWPDLPAEGALWSFALPPVKSRQSTGIFHCDVCAAHFQENTSTAYAFSKKISLEQLWRHCRAQACHERRRGSHCRRAHRESEINLTLGLLTSTGLQDLLACLHLQCKVSWNVCLQ